MRRASDARRDLRRQLAALLAFTLAAGFACNSMAASPASSGPCPTDSMGIRSTFNAPPQQQNPGQLSYLRDNASTVVAADLGIKLDCDWVTNSDTEILLSPTLEYHRDEDASASAAPVNKLSVGGQGAFYPEWRFVDWRGSQISAEPIVSVSGTRDIQQRLTYGTASAFLQLVGHECLSPFGTVKQFVDGQYVDTECTGIVHGQNPHTSLLLLYVPSVGVEYFDQLPLLKNGATYANGVNVGFATLRLNVEYWPIDHTDQGGLQLIANLMFRERLGGTTALPSSDSFETLQANYFFDKKNHFGAGLTLSVGRDSQRNFLFERLWQFGPRFKF